MISTKDLLLHEELQRILFHTNTIMCLTPHFMLNDWISSYNITFPTKDTIPDGFTSIPCACASLSIEVDEGNISVNLEGPNTKPFIIGNRANQLELLVSIEFKPAGLYTLTGINQNELADETISYDMIDPSHSKMLCAAVEKADSIIELVNDLDMLLLQNLRTTSHPQFKEAFSHIVENVGRIDIHSLARGIHYSERQMNRIFKQYAGVSTKTFSRIVRINSAIRLLKKPVNSIALVSDVMGFHDVSHFIRDFRLLCGVSPQTYRENMSDFYINTKRF